MDRLLRHALLASAAAHVAAVAALHPAEREVPSPPVIEARLQAMAPLPAPAVPPAATAAMTVADAAPASRVTPRRVRPLLAAAVPAVYRAPTAEARLEERALPAAPVSVAVVAAAAPVAVLAPPRYDAAYLANPPPPYPASARRRGIEGTSTVEARVGPGGDAREVKLAASAGDAVLDQAAIEAVRGWRFIPARRGEEAVEAWVRIPLVFRLD